MSEKTKGNRVKRTPPPLPNRQGMERIMADVTRLLQGQTFESVEEANLFLKENVSIGDPLPRSPLEQAQDLVYDAWDAATPREGTQLARQAMSRNSSLAGKRCRATCPIRMAGGMRARLSSMWRTLWKPGWQTLRRSPG
jgi:hypothetical protein